MGVKLQRQTVLLIVLLVVLVAAIAYNTLPSGGPFLPGTNGGAVPAAVAGGPAQGAVPLAVDVDLEGLGEERPEPADTGRNPFRFQARVPPPAPPPLAETAPTPPPAAAMPRPQPVVPAAQPIPLKFIGIVEAPEGRGRFAVLSDGRFVFHGREGAIIDGRYRIVRIGVESMELEHVDGRDRQTIRLSGS